MSGIARAGIFGLAIAGALLPFGCSEQKPGATTADSIKAATRVTSMPDSHDAPPRHPTP